MKHLRIYEKYEMDESADIAQEYVKLIISRYIDNLEAGETLQNSFDFYCEELEDESLRLIVLNEISRFLDKISDSSRLLNWSDNYYLKKDAKKYNL